ncbi:hypothetical protein NDU88_007932 [Pleurodeles waltl]|uniref:Uncharacterized protein n=1 Tax=Pleurodeles waltl TaxID=8319 RepID=A0AAV7VUA8_PLEWA|nr:hypothetical protein NDU88_007932 [Pleurodeles waltl]
MTTLLVHNAHETTEETDGDTETGNLKPGPQMSVSRPHRTAGSGGCKKEATRATGLLRLHRLCPEPGSKIGPWGSGVLDLPAVDSLAPYNNWIALHPRGSEEEEETEAALYLRGPHPDPRLRVDAARDCEDNARELEIGAERQADKERKPESLQQGNDISPPRTALETSVSNA